MILDYTEKGKLKIDMKYYINNIVNEFLYELNENEKTPWNHRLFKVNTTIKKLDEKRKSIYLQYLCNEINVSV